MLNNVNLIGRLTKDPELKTTQNGTAVCVFDIAVRKYEKGEKAANFFRCVAWRQQAEFTTRYLSKGALIAIGGMLNNREFEDKNKNKRTMTEVVVRELHALEKKSDEKKENRQEDDELLPYADDDVPF